MKNSIKNEDKLKNILSFLKDKGFVYGSSNIYGGLSNAWDYGPLGSMLKNNIKNSWRKFFINQQENIYDFDSSIILNSQVWKNSGHIDKFSDLVINCLNNNKNYRVDHLIEENTKYNFNDLNLEEMEKIIKNEIYIPEFKKNTKWGEIKEFNLMFKTNSSKIDNDKNSLYLRPETAQGIFINFKNILNTYNPTIPFGVGQIGKAFRNEVTPGNFIFRTKEFEQLELEYFVEEKDEKKSFDKYLNLIRLFLKKLNISEKNIREFDVPKEDLAHYSKKTVDFEYNFPFGWGELLGLANRGDFDLKNHSKNSIEDLIYIDKKTNKKFYPSIIETSIGVERLFFAIISDNLKIIKNGEEEREVLTLPYEISPYKIAVLPLTNKLDEFAYNLYKELLKKDFGPITYLKSGSIGKRYRKSDMIGVPFTITIDFESSNDKCVTIRNRNTTEQERVKISKIEEYIYKKCKTI